MKPHLSHQPHPSRVGAAPAVWSRLGLSLVLLVLSSLSACRDAPEGPDPWLGWERIDLLTHPPHVAQVGERFAPVEIVPQGRSLHRNQRAMHQGGRLSALRQNTRDRLIRSYDLPAEASFQFTPVTTEEVGCDCTFQVWVRTEPPAQLIFEVDAPPPRLESPTEPETVDLSSYAPGPLTLILILAPRNEGPEQPLGSEVGYWGNPQIVGRQADGSLADAAAAPSSLDSDEPPHDLRPNVLLIGADTLRADALGAWGREPSVTPALDRLARESDVYLRAYSTFNATNPSFTSIFTGLYGTGHGVLDQATLIPERLSTLAEQFEAAGYSTLGVFSALHARFALGRGFEYLRGPRTVIQSREAVDETLRWLDRFGQAERPFFAFVHLWDAHTPHRPEESFANGRHPAGLFGLGPVTEWRDARQPGPVEFTSHFGGGGAPELYVDEVASMDRQMDRLFAYLSSQGLLERTVVAFVSDHGENVGEHINIIGHRGLFETTTHVPLMVRWPESLRGDRRRGRRFEELVQPHDLFATLLSAVNLPVPEGIHARILPSSDHGLEPRPYVFSQHPNGIGESVRSDRYRLSFHRKRRDLPARGLWDHRSDPGETEDLFEREPEVARELQDALELFLEGATARAEAEEIDEEQRRQLEALGYVD